LWTFSSVAGTRRVAEGVPAAREGEVVKQLESLIGSLRRSPIGIGLST
jgi:hypothetical protein